MATPDGGGHPSTNPAASPTQSNATGYTPSQISYSGSAFGTQAPVQYNTNNDPPPSGIAYLNQPPPMGAGPQPRAFHGRNFDGAPADAAYQHHRQQLRCCLLVGGLLIILLVCGIIVAVALSRSSSSSRTATTRRPYNSWDNDRSRFKVENSSEIENRKVA